MLTSSLSIGILFQDAITLYHHGIGLFVQTGLNYGIKLMFELNLSSLTWSFVQTVSNQIVIILSSLTWLSQVFLSKPYQISQKLILSLVVPPFKQNTPPAHIRDVCLCFYLSTAMTECCLMTMQVQIKDVICIWMHHIAMCISNNIFSKYFFFFSGFLDRLCLYDQVTR